MSFPYARDGLRRRFDSGSGGKGTARPIRARHRPINDKRQTLGPTAPFGAKGRGLRRKCK